MSAGRLSSDKAQFETTRNAMDAASEQDTDCIGNQNT